MLTLVVVEGIVILLLVVLVAGLLRSHAEILRTLDRLGASEDGVGPAHAADIGLGPTRRSTGTVPVEAISGVEPSGAARTVALTGSRGYLLVAFLSSGCSTCQAFWKAFDREFDLPSPAIRPVIVTKGAHEESPSDIAMLAPTSIPTLMSSEAWDSFRVPGTPYFQLIDSSDGAVLGEGSASTWARLGEMIERSLADDERPRPGLRRSTAERMVDSDEELLRAGIEPGDESLWNRPDGGEG